MALLLCWPVPASCDVILYRIYKIRGYPHCMPDDPRDKLRSQSLKPICYNELFVIYIFSSSVKTQCSSPDPKRIKPYKNKRITQNNCNNLFKPLIWRLQVWCLFWKHPKPKHTIRRTKHTELDWKPRETLKNPENICGLI